MMFAANIEIDRNPQRVRYQRSIEMPDGLFSIEDISKHLKEGELFSFRDVETGQFGTTLYMDIVGYRMETEEELKIRVEREEKYMNAYYEFHKKYDKK